MRGGEGGNLRQNHIKRCSMLKTQRKTSRTQTSQQNQEWSRWQAEKGWKGSLADCEHPGEFSPFPALPRSPLGMGFGRRGQAFYPFYVGEGGSSEFPWKYE